MKPSAHWRGFALVLLTGIELVSFSVVRQPVLGAEPQSIPLPPAVGGEPVRVASAVELANEVRVNTGGERLSLQEAIDRASADRELATYRQLRMQHSETALGQREIALWCRKHGLVDEERLHWQILLQMQPEHPDAIKGLKLRKFKGKLLTVDGIKQAKEGERLARDAERKWGPKLAQLKLAIDQGSAAERRAAMDELEAIHDPHAMALAETLLSNGGTEVALLVVEMYARAVTAASTEALARLAIYSEDGAIREKAAGELRYRPVEDYMPSLLIALAAPIELSMDADYEPGRPTFQKYDSYVNTGRIVPGLYGVIRLSGNYTNRDVLIWTLESKRFSGSLFTGYQPDRHRYEYVLTRDSPDPNAPYEFRGGFSVSSSAGSVGQELESVRRSIAALQKRIEELNVAAAEMNERIDASLREALQDDASLADVPKATAVRPRLWWDWWNKRLNLNNYLFRGTEVWTELGLIPIERLIVGDRVLTKDHDTGELEFNLVNGIDSQPAREVRELEVGSRTIVATLDQPFFVTDAGWRAAEKLEVGMEIDSLDGARRIENLRPGTADATFSLLIANRPNYFVEPHGILVHDATQP